MTISDKLCYITTRWKYIEIKLKWLFYWVRNEVKPLKNNNYTEGKRKTLNALNPYILSGEISIHSLEINEPICDNTEVLRYLLDGLPLTDTIQKEKESR